MTKTDTGYVIATRSRYNEHLFWKNLGRRRRENKEKEQEQEADLCVAIEEFVTLTQAPIFLICGDAGVGKTSLVRQILSSQFVSHLNFGSLAWATDSLQDEFDEQMFFNRLKDSFKITADDGKAEDVRQLLKDHVKTLEKPLLLVVDDVRHHEIFACVKGLGDNMRTICISQIDYFDGLKSFNYFSDAPFYIEKYFEE